MKMVMEKMRYLYGQFIETVANGRKARGLTVARVDELGRGQVWTGAQALSVGLVDRLGGLADAIDEAVRLGKIPVGRDKMPDVQVLPHAPLDLIRRLAAGGADDQGASGSAGPAKAVTPTQLLTPDMRAALRMLAPTLLSGGTGVQARLPYDIEMR
jgi:protease-4